MKKHGITLLVLVITMIVMVILAGGIILSVVNGSLFDKTKRAKFMSDYRNVQEAVQLYSLSKYNAESKEFEAPIKGYLTATDKTYIKNNVTTLNAKIEELSGPIDSTNLAWIDSDKINVTLASEKAEKGYILDVATGLIYDYNGEYFEGQMWHTLDSGILSDGRGIIAAPGSGDEIWNGWIKINLFYPAGSTDRKWRLGTEGELRADPLLMWQDYTGPITVPIDRVKDVWIKYKINNQEVTIPPVGTLLVDIVPDKTGATKVDRVTVSITYDETATTKEYRVGNSGWISYTGPFAVTENCIIEARASKTEYIYNTDGTFLTSRNVSGKDLLYIGNIGIEETDLPAPTITRLPGVGAEKAKVQVTYPANADKKVYKINYGAEDTYTSEISVTSYGTYIIAYYYDSTGKRSKAASIRINDPAIAIGSPPTTGTQEAPVPYEPLPPYTPGGTLPPYNPSPTDPYSDYIPAPTIKVSPTTQTTEVQVSVIAPSDASKTYLKLGKYGEYQNYTSPVTVKDNMEVYAYYRTNSGEKSDIARGVVSNIKKPGKPYVYINANPYPWTGSSGADKVTVTIQYADANTIEYSEDGIIYKPYTGAFDVTENKIIYARGTNAIGVTETSLNINNIGVLTAPTPTQKLIVNINASPEPLYSSSGVSKVTINIDYDSRSTGKYYTIGKYGQMQTYSGQFDVSSNCTIYAYALATNSKGETIKTIDNIDTGTGGGTNLNGISEPVIISNPTNNIQATKVNISITYDRNATIKKYSLDGGALLDYNGEFEVTKADTVVYAYSENAGGQSSDATYTVQNILPDPPVLFIDKSKYYLLKLNYPEKSQGREYKWKPDGVWTTYKEAGILLIKPQYKDQLIPNGTLIKIEDENGNLITFTGDYYFLDVAVNELTENIYMRWDRMQLGAPQIILNPTDATKQVTATILYNSALIKKQYKVIKPGDTSALWRDYTGPILIDTNNTVIFANGMDDSEVWTPDATAKVTNIDEQPPVISLIADLTTAVQKVPIKVNVTDDVSVGKVKWAEGAQGESYFATSGTEILNGATINITNNGYYTFYAEDTVGNKQVYTLNVTNIDLTPPLIDMSISPLDTTTITSNVTINYGESTVKQYKIGTSNTVWSTYTNTLSVTSYTVLANNWQNADGTVTIYAKGKDSSGNEVTIEKKITNLDLDRPNAPTIATSSGYPIMSSYGVVMDSKVTITYDTRTDLNNLYTTNNGTTWITYTGPFDMTSGTVIAKSVKKVSGLETSKSQTITLPTDGLKSPAYDYNDSTYINVNAQYLLVDTTMQGKNIRVRWQGGVSGAYGAVASTIKYLDSNKNVISSVSSATGSTPNNYIYTIPSNAKWIRYECLTGGDYGRLYEIQSANEPTFSAVNGYMLLHTDSTKAIRDPYQMVTVNYFSTSVQKLYKIGTAVDWTNYTQPVKVIHGQTIYAKGIDANGIETRIISSYTSNSTDALKREAYDYNDSTYINVTNQYIQVDSSMIGKNLRVRWAGGVSGAYGSVASTLRFLDVNKNVISSVSSATGSTAYTYTYTVPANTKWIRFECLSGGDYGRLYEIEPTP